MKEKLGIYPLPKKVEAREGRGTWSAVFEVHAEGEPASEMVVKVRLEERLAKAAAERGGYNTAVRGEYHADDRREYVDGAMETRSTAADALHDSNDTTLKLANQARCDSELQLHATIIHVEHDSRMHSQGYRLEWDGESLRVGCGDAEGLHYAVVALEQMMERRGRSWDGFYIEDEPDIPVRGVMLDIGRNKIPRMETLRGLIDTMSGLKLNHLQLYIEGFAFDYAPYRDSFPEATPITAEQFRELDLYARERFIDLVPNQNCLGHMGPWLAKPEFRELAEHPDGMPTPVAYKLPPLTLDPTDERSIGLVRVMWGELLPHSASEYANINMDEPFGLGTGRSKPRADEIGTGRLYLEFAEKVFDVVRGHGKRILMWGDIVTKHEEIIPLLPKDVTVLAWNYECHTSFEAQCKLLSGNDVPFYVCPGTSGWSSIAGRTENMLSNIEDAARNGLAYGADGLIVTDWGDSGHWQPLMTGYPAYAYAAGVAWGLADNTLRRDLLEQYVSERMLRDRSGFAGGLLLELGRYERLERSTLENMTYTSYLLNRNLTSREQLEAETDRMIQLLVVIGGRGIPFQLDYRYEEMLEWLAERDEELAGLKLETSPDGETAIAELANSIRLIRHASGLHRYIFRIGLEDAEAELAWLRLLKEELAVAIGEFERLWRLRNREGGLAASTANLYRLLGQYEERIAELAAD